MKTIYITLLGIIFLSLPQLASTQNFYLHPNGVTCMCPDAAIGDTGTVNGVTYTKRTRWEITSQNAENTCTSGITEMHLLFENTSFNGNISSWDVSDVVYMSKMFYDTPFNQPIGNWDVSNVTDMLGMFMYSSFNQPIGEWNVGNVTDMSSMFSYTPFDQPIGNWDVGNVTSMSGLFFDTPFNQPIEDWNVSNVINMSAMFTYSLFKQPIGNWDVSNVTDMLGMFLGSDFNHSIGNWNVSSVTNMSWMFWNNSEFNQDISTWIFHPDVIFSQSNLGFINGSIFSIQNYDLLLQSFSDQNLQNKNFLAYDLMYCNVSARNDLINNKGWSFLGDNTIPTFIIAPNNITLIADEGSCVATNVDLGLPTGQGCLSYTISNNAPEIFPLGVTQVIWTIEVSNGITDSDIQVVDVTIDVDTAKVCYVSSDEIEITKNRIFIDNANWSNVNYYEVLRESSSGIFLPIGILAQGESSFLDSTSDNTSQTYRYSVRTLDICENMSPNAAIHRTILLQSNISVSNTVNLYWVGYEGVIFNSYKIYRKVNNGDFELIATMASNNTLYTDNQANVLENKYEYYVAIEVQPCSTGSRFTTVEIKSNKAVIGTDGILDFPENQVIVHPNPTSNMLDIMLPENITLISVNIYNTFGQKVMTAETTRFSVERLSQSTYFIKILTSAGEVTKSFIKY